MRKSGGFGNVDPVGDPGEEIDGRNPDWGKFNLHHQCVASEPGMAKENASKRRQLRNVERVKGIKPPIRPFGVYYICLLLTSRQGFCGDLS